MSGATPVLIYDGECNICREWVGYWLSLSGNRIIYRPYQSAAGDYPEIPETSFRTSMILIEPGGQTFSGAAAAFRLLSHVPGHGLGWGLYRYLPGFAAISELAYRYCANHRGRLRYLTHLLWGRHYTVPRYGNVQWWFLRGLGLVYIFAFVSAGVQITGLIGESGLLPLSAFLERMQGYYGGLAWYHAPTLFWLNSSDWMLEAACAAGAAAGGLILLNRFVITALVAAFVLYLGILHAGQDFFLFQWDLLLVETGFLAIFLPRWPTMSRWLYRWLVFRYMFMVGMAKLSSGDPTWHGLHALEYHFETQPLPSPLAWYAHYLPDSLLMLGTAFTLILEIALIFLVVAPRRLRMLLAWLIILFQTGILLTGNYNFFNLLTMLLTLWLFDDAALARLTGGSRSLLAQPVSSGISDSIFCVLFSAVIVLPGINHITRITLHDTFPPGRQIHGYIEPFNIVNYYGLFANMTTKRPEIIIEGSLDEQTWRAYRFRYKPGDPETALGWNIPHQPRLDWQMWFAGLGSPTRHPWFETLLIRLLQNEPEVTQFFAENPFPESGPRFIRARLYYYRFSQPGDGSGEQWWRRQPSGLYYPAVTLGEIARQRRGIVPFRE